MNFEKLKGLFIVSEENSKDKKEPEEKDLKKDEKKEVLTNDNQKKPSFVKSSTSETVNIQQQNVQHQSVSIENTEGSLNQKVFDSLSRAIAGANLPGEDYFEFFEAFEAMKNIPIDDRLKIQTVLATLSPKGLTVAKVIESADYYMKILGNEKEKFNNVLQNQTSVAIVKRKDEIGSIELSMQQKAEQIQILTSEITKLQEEIIKIKNEIGDSDNKIKKAENDFNFTYNIFVNQINGFVEKIKSI